MFKEAGLEECTQEVILTDREPSMKAGINTTLMVAFEGICRVVLAVGGAPGLQTEEDIRALVDGANKDFEDVKAYYSFEIYVVVGKNA